MTSFVSSSGGAYFELSTTAGVVERSRSLGGKDLPAPAPNELAPLPSRRDRRLAWTITDGFDGHRLRVVTLVVSRGRVGDGDDDAAPDGPRVTVAVQVARSLADVDRARRQALSALAIALPIALLIGSAGAFLVAWRATSPIERLSRDARAIGAGSLARLDLSRVEGELRVLGETLNAAFDRLGEAIEREHRFSSDAAHELRTPLSIARSRLELTAMRERDPKEYQAAIATALEALDRLEKVASSLLVLARAESGSVAGERHDLRAIASRAVESTRPLAQSASVPLSIALPDVELPVVGSGALLERVIANLVENSVRHGGSPAGVEIQIRAVEPGAEVHVLDRGPGFPDDFLPRAFERFARGDASRTRATGGAGLGLAIARAIARAHGGEVAAARREGGGAEVVVTLPVARPA
jgi:signal transduction histidine kinase